MPHLLRILWVAVFLGSAVGVSVRAGSAAEQRLPLELSRTMVLSDVGGRIDHLAVDLKRSRLFVAALGNNTVEVLDLAKGTRLHTISGLSEPQGIAYLSDSDCVVVACAGDGVCHAYDGRAYREVWNVNLKEDADNVRYDGDARRVYVGYGGGALAAIDPRQGRIVAEVALPGHPESFQLEAKGNRICVNVPAARQVVVVDRKGGSVAARWPVGAEANFPMALDEANHRLFVGCRKPARMLVLDTATGKPVASVACSGDADDLFYDGLLKRVYLVGGEGTISVFQQADPDHYTALARVATAPGARTGLWTPASRVLYVAVPRRGSRAAEIREYKPAAISP